MRKGLRLRFASWQSVLRERRGTVCIFPGRAEFIEKYFEVVGELRRRGFAVAVLDWRGQGGSSRLTRNPLKGHINDFAEYEEDLSHFMKAVVLPDCPAPLFRARPLHGVNGAVQGGDQARLLVHAHGLDRAHGADHGPAHVAAAVRAARGRAYDVRLRQARGAGRQDEIPAGSGVRGQPSHLGPRALHAQSVGASGGARARDRGRRPSAG